MAKEKYGRVIIHLKSSRKKHIYPTHDVEKAYRDWVALVEKQPDSYHICGFGTAWIIPAEMLSHIEFISAGRIRTLLLKLWTWRKFGHHKQ